jgi:hypothetical protein
MFIASLHGSITELVRVFLDEIGKRPRLPARDGRKVGEDLIGIRDFASGVVGTMSQ